jgi:hypothetical protein
MGRLLELQTLIFWFMRKKWVESYFCLTATKRAKLGPNADLTTSYD